MFIRISLIGSLFLSAAASLMAQTTWTDVGGDAAWSTSSNWSNGVPGSSTDVIIGTNPSAGLIGLDTGGGITIKSLVFNAGLSPFFFTPLGSETLTVNGAITNNTTNSSLVEFDNALFAGASATWTGPLKFANNVGFGTNTITLSGSSTFTTNSNINFDITSLSTYGHFLGSGTATVTGVTINIGGSYTGSSGDTFDFTSGDFSGATLGTLPTLSGGMTWNTSSFLSTGVLSVVAAIPEPSTYGALFGVAAVGFGVWRKRRKA